jgi:hypothetical protein
VETIVGEVARTRRQGRTRVFTREQNRKLAHFCFQFGPFLGTFFFVLNSKMNTYQHEGEILAACFLRQKLGKDVAKQIITHAKIPKPGKLKKVSPNFAYTISQMNFINVIIQFPAIASSSTFVRYGNILLFHFEVVEYVERICYENIIFMNP